MAYNPYTGEDDTQLNMFGSPITNVGTDFNNQMAYVPGSDKDKFLKNLYEMKSTYGETGAYKQNLQKDWDNYKKTGDPLSLPKQEYSGVKGFASLEDKPYDFSDIRGQTATLPQGAQDIISDASLYQGEGTPTPYLGSRSPIPRTINVDRIRTDPAFGALLQKQRADTSYPGSFAMTNYYDVKDEIPRLQQDDFYENFKNQQLAERGITAADAAQIFPRKKPILEDPNFQEGRKQHGETYGPLGPDPFKFPSIMEGIRSLVKPMSPELKAQSRAFQDMGYVDPSQPQNFAGGPMKGYNIASAFGSNDPSLMIMDRINKIKNRKMAQTETSIARIAKLQEMKEAADRAAATAQPPGGGTWVGGAPAYTYQGQGGGEYRDPYTGSRDYHDPYDPGGGEAHGGLMRTHSRGRVGYKTGGRVGILAAF